MARLLGVRTGRFSLLPRPLKNGRLQLGFVETSSTDLLRDAFIGAAPLLAGGALVAYVGLIHLDLAGLWQRVTTGSAANGWQALGAFPASPDFWLWLYLSFAVSSTMLPSSSDRRAWLPVSLVILLLLGASLLAGAGPWLAANLAAPLNRFLRIVAAVFGISLALHLIFLLPFWLLRRLLSRMLGLEVV